MIRLVSNLQALFRAHCSDEGERKFLGYSEDLPAPHPLGVGPIRIIQSGQI